MEHLTLREFFDSCLSSSFLALSCLVSPCLDLSRLVWCCLVLSGAVLVLACRVVSCRVVSCLASPPIKDTLYNITRWATCTPVTLAEP